MYLSVDIDILGTVSSVDVLVFELGLFTLLVILLALALQDRICDYALLNFGNVTAQTPVYVFHGIYVTFLRRVFRANLRLRWGQCGGFSLVEKQSVHQLVERAALFVPEVVELIEMLAHRDTLSAIHWSILRLAAGGASSGAGLESADQVLDFKGHDDCRILLSRCGVRLSVKWTSDIESGNTEVYLTVD